MGFSSGEIPCNCRQVNNIKQPKGDNNDDLLRDMATCKQSMDKDEKSFVQMVRSVPEPMCACTV